MYKVTPRSDLQIKTYWCTSSDLAKQIASDIEKRFGCTCAIEDVPDKRSWESGAECARRFVLSGGVELRCTSNEIKDAQAHARNDVLKISAQEIFCFPAEDQIWLQK